MNEIVCFSNSTTPKFPHERIDIQLSIFNVSTGSQLIHRILVTYLTFSTYYKPDMTAKCREKLLSWVRFGLLGIILSKTMSKNELFLT